MGSLALQEHERGQHDGHLRSRSLERVRVAIMAGTEHPNPISMGDKAAARKANLPQKFIHDESNTGHVSAVL